MQTSRIDEEPFEMLCGLWEKVSAVSLKPRQKIALIESYVKRFPRNSKGFFALFRLLLPALDRDRTTYGLREIALSRLYIEAFVLPATEAKRLRYYRDPSRANIETKAGLTTIHPRVGDFPSILHAILEHRVTLEDKTHLKITDVNTYLDELCQTTNIVSKAEILRERLAKATALHHKWICRIILSDLKLGIGFERILNILDPALSNVFNQLGDLKTTIKKFEENYVTKGSRWMMETSLSPIQSIEPLSMAVEVFRPLRPMLAKRLTVGAVESFLSGANNDKRYLMEPKLDGERLLCHIARRPRVTSKDRVNKDDHPPNTSSDTSCQIVFYTRSGNSEYPSAYIDHFSNLLENSIKVEEAILDGELLVWNRLTEQLIRFGSARSVGVGKLDHADLLYVIFDVLHVKNEGKTYDIAALPWHRRRQLLEKVVTQQTPKRLELIEFTHITSADNIQQALEKVVEERKEGIMIKAWDSQYCLGRRDAGWYKLKPDFGWLADTLDLLVVGCFLAEGTRRRKATSSDPIDHISAFLLATIDDDKQTIKTFTKVGTGFTFEELREMIDLLRPHLKRLCPTDPLPTWTLDWKPSSSSRPDFVLDHFSHGFVMEVVAAEIVASDAFALGYTLRFPRSVSGNAIRQDKAWEDCERSADIIAMMRSDNPEKRRRVILSDTSDNEIIKGRRRIKRREVIPSHRSRPDLYLDIGYTRKGGLVDVKSIKLDTKIFDKKLVHVLPFSMNSWNAEKVYFEDKKSLEEFLKKAGAIISQTYNPGHTDYLIADGKSVRSRHLNTTGDEVVYNHLFVYDSICQNRIHEADPKYVVHPDRKLRSEWQQALDEHGDWYTKPFESEEDLSNFIETMDVRSNMEDLTETAAYPLGFLADTESSVTILVWDPQIEIFRSLTNEDLRMLQSRPIIDFDRKTYNPDCTPMNLFTYAHLVLPPALRHAVKQFSQHSICQIRLLLQVYRRLAPSGAMLVTSEEIKPGRGRHSFILMCPDTPSQKCLREGNSSTQSLIKQVEELKNTFPDAEFVKV